MAGTVRFLCCAKAEADVITWPEGDGELSVPLDEDGFLICPEHGERRYGWRSRPERDIILEHATETHQAVVVERPDFGANDSLRNDQAFVDMLFAGLRGVSTVTIPKGRSVGISSHEALTPIAVELVKGPTSEALRKQEEWTPEMQTDRDGQPGRLWEPEEKQA